jgi:hypothetical protein
VQVPLCGKTKDLVHLSATNSGVTEVVGVEGIPQALIEFKQEASGHSWRSGLSVGPYSVWQSGAITLMQGDFFQMGADIFDAVWDRGSLVAIDPSVRLAT